MSAADAAELPSLAGLVRHPGQGAVSPCFHPRKRGGDTFVTHVKLDLKVLINLHIHVGGQRGHARIGANGLPSSCAHASTSGHAQPTFFLFPAYLNRRLVTPPLGTRESTCPNDFLRMMADCTGRERHGCVSCESTLARPSAEIKSTSLKKAVSEAKPNQTKPNQSKSSRLQKSKCFDVGDASSPKHVAWVAIERHTTASRTLDGVQTEMHNN